MAFEPGQRAGDYEILEVIGKGGMGLVYRVRNVLSNRTEAMKVLLSNFASEPQLGERFLAEIRTVARLDHPNIARLHTAFQVDNQLMMIMEFVEGTSLAEAARRGPLPLDAVFSYADQILAALAYAHKSGVIHRDIKPSNIMVTPAGVAKLMDFGIAKSASDPMKTSPGTTMGSVMYMSPEQVRGVDVDARSDLYSFGILLYELVAGRAPFVSETTFAILEAHLKSIPKAPIALNPALPPALSDLILTALQKEPSLRFANADAFRNALQSVRRELGTTDPEYAPTVLETSPIAALPQTPQGPPVRQQVTNMPPPILASTAPRGNRTLWMAAGALACVAVLVGAAVMVPRLFRNPSAAVVEKKSNVTQQSENRVKAEEGKSASRTTPADGKTANPQEQQKTTFEPAVTGKDKSVQQPAVVSEKRDETPATSSNQAGKKAPRIVSQARVKDPATHTNYTPPPKSVPEQATAEPAVSQTQTPTSAAAVPAGPSQGELDKAEEELTQLRARAESIRTSVNNMRSQQAADGLGLRPDMATAASLMDSYLNASQQALQANNLDKAKKSMGSAEVQIGKLESFFNK